MRPENARIWRKGQRAVVKGIPAGRRTSHRAETQAPTPGSTWNRRQRAKTPPGLFSRIESEAQ